MIMVATSRQQASLEPRTGKRLALSLECGAPCGLLLSALEQVILGDAE